MPTRRERAQALAAGAQHRRQHTRLAAAGAAALVLLLGAAMIASGAFAPAAPGPAAAGTSESPQCNSIQSFPTQSRDHIQPNEPHPAYSSNPPTSGWHWANPQDWGAYLTPQVQEQLVHNLEHGGIVIQYNGLSAPEVQQLVDLFKADSYHLILAPYPGLPANVRVALTAWDHLQTCTGVVPDAIRSFTNGYRNKGPEFIP